MDSASSLEVLQRFDSSEKSRFCSKTALPKCLKINDWLFCKIAKARGFSAKSKSCNTSLRFGSHRVVGRPQRCDQQDTNEGANADGGNPGSRWGTEIHIDDAGRVISHGRKAIGVWGFI